jgi:hypothetical protein
MKALKILWGPLSAFPMNVMGAAPATLPRWGLLQQEQAGAVPN